MLRGCLKLLERFAVSMKNFAKLPVEDRKEVFQAVAGNMGLRPDIIKKDFERAKCTCVKSSNKF